MKYIHACFPAHLDAWRVILILGLAIGLALLSGVASHAQQRGAPNRAPATQEPAPQPPGKPGTNTDGLLADTHKDYLIAPGDVIEVWVEDAPELSRAYRVNATGEFPMDVVGKVPAKQKTTEELARHIATRLREEEFLNKPNVVVSVRQYNSQTFIVQGAVNRPGVYQLEGRPSLLTLIGLAGGLNDNHGSAAFILRRKTPPVGSEETGAKPLEQAADAAASKDTEQPPDKPQADKAQDDKTQDAKAQDNEAEEANDYELIKVNLAALYKGHFEHNQTLEPRDIVNIPRADVFFVAGEVNVPGSYPLKEGTTLRQAISLAQGMTFKAKAGRGVIFREDPDSGQRQELKVDFNAVMNGKREDILITANDVIIVPNSRTKSISSALLNALGTNSARIPVRY